MARADDGGLTLEPGGDRLDVQRVFAIPRIVGPALDGLACDEEGFIVTREDGRVGGARHTWAAGDGIASPVKFGGLATHQARLAAAGVAKLAGVTVVDPGEPVLHGRLLVGRRTRRLRGRGDAEGAPLWWPHGKVAGEFLPRWLAENGVVTPGSVPPPEDEGVPVQRSMRALRAPEHAVPVRARPRVPDGRPGDRRARPADARDGVAVTLTSPLNASALDRRGCEASMPPAQAAASTSTSPTTTRQA